MTIKLRVRRLAVVALIAVVLVPSMHVRLARMTGDDKVYVAQTIEMMEAGTWFKQRLAGVPAFLKGPFHTVMVRLGTEVWGYSMFSTLYMNLLLIGAAVFLLMGLLSRWAPDEWTLWMPLAFVFSIDIYLHTFASMMDVELAMAYMIAAVAATRGSSGWRDLGFWMTVGASGWIKSPANSFLMGVSGILFWLVTGQWRQRGRNWKSWASAGVGVAVCVLGYVPLAWGNWEFFYRQFLIGENLSRTGNGFPWWTIWESNLGFSLLPWTLFFWASVVWMAVALVLWLRRRRRIKSDAWRIWCLGFSFAAPTIAFFTYHPYRHNHYGLPAIGGLLLMTVGSWMDFENYSRVASRWLWQGLSWITGLGMAAMWVGLIVVVRHFAPMPPWWSAGWFVFACAAMMVATLVWTTVLKRPAQAGAWVLFCAGFTSVLGMVGEREMSDLRTFLQKKHSNGQGVQLAYYNVHTHPWSEWAYLRYMIGRSVEGIHSEESLLQSIRSGKTLLVPGDEWLEQLRRTVRLKLPGMSLDAIPWRRWYTRGRTETGAPAWEKAWQERDFKWMERNYWIVEIRGATPATNRNSLRPAP